MAKGGGSTRTVSANNASASRKSSSASANTTSVSQRFSNDANNLVKQLTSNKIDYNTYEDKRLQQLIRKGKSYEEGSLEKAIESYVQYGLKKNNGKYMSIEHANMSGAKSEVIRYAQLKNIHDKIPQLKEILNNRKRK